MGKEFTCSAGDSEDVGLIPESGRSHGEGHGHPLQYSCLENPMDRGDWCTIVRGVAKSWTLLSAHVHTHTHTRYIYTLYINICMTEVTEHTLVTLTCFILCFLGNWLFHFLR